MSKRVIAVTLVLGLSACSGECLALPCAIPMAAKVLVTSAFTGAAVIGVSLAVSGPVATTMHCDSSCVVTGYPGTYTLVASAPGYQSLERTVAVRGVTPACGCASVQTEQVTLTLTPNP